MAVTFTDAEYGDVAEALEWPRQRIFRYPFAMTLMGPSQPFVLDARLGLLDEATKVRALALARDILARKAEAREELFDGLPDVTRAGEIHKDARLGYESRKAALSDMRHDLARMVDFAVNPQVGSAGQPCVIG